MVYLPGWGILSKSEQTDSSVYAPYKKTFFQCNTPEELVFVFNVLKEYHRTEIVDIDKYEIPENGIIVFVRPTSMVWGEIFLKRNTRTQRNELREQGYIEHRPDELIKSEV